MVSECVSIMFLTAPHHALQLLGSHTGNSKCIAGGNLQGWLPATTSGSSVLHCKRPRCLKYGAMPGTCFTASCCMTFSFHMSGRQIGSNMQWLFMVSSCTMQTWHHALLPHSTSPLLRLALPHSTSPLLRCSCPQAHGSSHAALTRGTGSLTLRSIAHSLRFSGNPCSRHCA
jgi:hypothetical protein